MGLSVTLNPTKAEGFAKLEAVEAAMSVGQTFTMAEAVEADADPRWLRYAWDNNITTLVGHTPLRYEVTKFGLQLVANARKIRERQERQQEAIAA